MKKFIALLLSLVMVCMALAACGGGGGESNDGAAEAPNAGDPIRITSFGDTAGEVFAQILEQELMYKGYEIEDCERMDVYAFRDAMINDKVDMVMDYEGDGPSYMGDDVDLMEFQKNGWQMVSEWDLENNDLVWFNPSEANNVGVIVCTKETAEANNLSTFADFADYVKNGGETKLVGPEFWIDGEYKFLLMEKAYNFKLDRNTQVQYAEGTNEKMCAEGVDGVNFAVAWAHSGSINVLDLVPLKDEQETTMRYSYCPVIRKDVLDQYPEIRDIIEPIFEAVTDDDARWLNEQVEANGRPADEVAIEYLTNKGWME